MAVWAWIPDLTDFNEGVRTKTLISDMGGRRKRYPKGTPLRTFTLKYPSIEDDVADQMLQFFYDHHGEAYSFDFIHPKTGDTIRVCFDMPDMDKSSFYFIVSNVGIKLIEELI